MNARKMGNVEQESEREAEKRRRRLGSRTKREVKEKEEK